MVIVKIAVSEFKARCLRLIDQMAQGRDPIVLTKRGKPVAKLVPIDDEIRSDLFGYMAGSATISGDIVSPIEGSWGGGDDHLYDGLADPPGDHRKRKSP